MTEPNTNQLVQKLQMPSDILVGQYLQFIALHIAAAIAFIHTCGFMLGEWVHKTNNTLSKNVQQWFTLTRSVNMKSLYVQVFGIS